MKRSLLLLFSAFTLLSMKCSNGNASGDARPEEDSTKPEKGYVKGRVTDAKGKPLQGVKIVVDGMYSGTSGRTGPDGRYRIRVGNLLGFRVYAWWEKYTYNGETYDKIDMTPEDIEPFAGADGAIRNFTWKLTGARPTIMGGGYYGGFVNLHPYNSEHTVEELEFTLVPDGPLIDGSKGETLVKKSAKPRQPDYSKLMDIPMGRYKVTAKAGGQPVKLKLQENDDFSNEIILDFKNDGYSCTQCNHIDFQ